MWYKKFEWFRIVDVRKRYVVNFQEGNLNELLPLSLKKFANTIEQSKQNSRVIRSRIKSISDIFRKFKSHPDIHQRLWECVSTDKPGNIEFKSIYGDLKKLFIRGIPLDVYYTGSNLIYFPFEISIFA
jgi:hypothetical protein